MTGVRRLLGTCLLSAFSLAPILGAGAAHGGVHGTSEAASTAAAHLDASAHHEHGAPEGDRPVPACPMPWGGGEGGCMIGASCLSGLESVAGTASLRVDEAHAVVRAEDALTPPSAPRTPDRPPPRALAG